MHRAYREIYEKGKFKDLIFVAENDESHEGKFWAMVAYFSLGKVKLAYKVAKMYSDTFVEIENKELRENFLRYSNLLENVIYELFNPPDSENEIHSQYYIPKNITGRLINLFPNVLGTLDDNILSNYQLNPKHVKFGEYYCKYSDSKGDRTKKVHGLKRQFLLLKELQNHLSLKVPNPIEFRSEEGSDLKAFIYKMIPGKTINRITKPRDWLDLILDLQQLHEIPPVKSLLREFTPEIDLISKELTKDRLIQRSSNNLTGEKAKIIRSFIELCMDHLPMNPDRTFVHGDLYTGNILFDDHDNITGIIDFERGFYADPWIDWCKLDYNDTTLKELLELYYDHVDQIDRDYTYGKILLYRGMFILRRMRYDSLFQLNYKIDSWIIQPYDKIVKLLD